MPRKSLDDLKRHQVSETQIEELAQRPYHFELEYSDDPKDGILARVAEWPTCFAAGDTREEAVKELERALRAMIAVHLEDDLPIPSPAAAYGGRVLLRLPKTVHRDADSRAKAEGVSLNQWLGSAIARELGPTTDKLKAVVGAGRRGGRLDLAAKAAKRR